MPGKVETTVREFIADNLMYQEGIEFLSESDSFLEIGLVDSMGILQLVTFLEATYSIGIAADEVLPENLDSIGRVVAFVRRKIASKDQAPSHAS